MERVHATSEKPVSEMDAVAVGIYTDRNHVGILHKEDASISPIIRLLHHCWHAELQNTTDIAKCAFWVAPSFSIRLGKIVAGYCRLIHNRNLNKVIPYGFGDIEDAFDRLGALAGDASINGLTCATFVLAVFHRAGAAIADYSSWPVRESHSKIQSGLMDRLEGDDSIPRANILPVIPNMRIDYATHRY